MEGGLFLGEEAYTMCKSISETKRSKIVNLLLRVTTSTANTLTAITLSLKVQMGTLRYLVPIVKY